METNFKKYGTILSREEAKKIKGGALADECTRFTCACGSTGFSTCISNADEIWTVAAHVCPEATQVDCVRID
jgi:hypothetical protein